jgi:nitrite reductase (NADH) large subunit
MASAKFVIVGCGVAGVNAALFLRKGNPEAEISIYGDEADLYYPRPRLYEVISGERQPQGIYSFPTQFYEKQQINLHLAKKATGLSVTAKAITFEDGSSVGYDKLLLATGAAPFVPPIKGTEKRGFFTLRTLTDAASIREQLSITRKAVVVGDGLLGLELAANLRKTGRDVTIIGLYPRLLPKQLDQDGSEMLQMDLKRLGINCVLNAVTTEILGNDQVTGVFLQDGRKLEAEIIVAATGVRPNVKLASNAGVKTRTGIVVDERLRTSVNDVYAAGDAIEFNGQVYGTIPPAIEQAKIAAANMDGNLRQVYKGTIQATTLRIAGITLTSIGIVNPQGSGYEEVKSKRQDDGAYKKIVLQNGKIAGAIFLGDKEGISEIRKLMEQGTDVSRHKNDLLDGSRID